MPDDAAAVGLKILLSLTYQRGGMLSIATAPNGLQGERRIQWPTGALRQVTWPQVKKAEQRFSNDSLYRFIYLFASFLPSSSSSSFLSHDKPDTAELLNCV